MKKQKQQRPRRSALAKTLTMAWATVCLASAAVAQTAPDAGQILQQLQPGVASPRESAPLNLQAPAALGSVQPGGPAVVVQGVSFSGNSVIGQDALQAALGPVAGQSFDMAGLGGLTDRITDFYRASGYPFAQAVLPPQDLAQGLLRIEVIEGRYGLVQAVSEDAAIARQVTPYLASLLPGAVIQSALLERTSLLIDDLPGLKMSPVIRPGALIGTGDLLMQVRPGTRLSGDLGMDNAGGRYTGQTRARANLNINSSLLLGDQIKLNALASDEQLWLGALGYSLPLGASGLRGNVGYTSTRYVLAKEFASLKANGTAAVTSAGLSYPLVRSQKSNVTLSSTYQAKDLRDNKDTTSTREVKSSASLPVALQFDHRDSLGGGGITYGGLTWTPGNLKLDAALTAADANNTRGSFNKINLDLVRLQNLPVGLSLMGRMNLQTASKNLDSSEKMSLGGSAGVRAYPSGEGSGDQAALAQIELRYSAGVYAPYVFMDGGTVKINAQPQASATTNKRNLSGAGLGLRYQRNAWNADGTLAWRHKGGAPQADTSSDPKPRLWVNVGYRF